MFVACGRPDDVFLSSGSLAGRLRESTCFGRCVKSRRLLTMGCPAGGQPRVEDVAAQLWSIAGGLWVFL